MVAPECAPAAKADGLGDVVSGLSRELELRGNAVEIILPKYASLRYSDIWDLQPSYHDLWVPWYGGAIGCTVWFGYVNGRKCFFIEPHSATDFFGRDRLYGYVFHHTDNPALESALGRALRLWSTHPREFGELAANCMRADYSWARPGQEYLDIYQYIRHK
jgi:glycogen synthase